jgi:hypothetical protein
MVCPLLDLKLALSYSAVHNRVTQLEGPMDNYHITKKDKVWQFKKNGKTIKNSATKKEAVNHMQGYMKGKTGSVKIHGEDGKIQEERTYPRSSDPGKTKYI